MIRCRVCGGTSGGIAVGDHEKCRDCSVLVADGELFFGRSDVVTPQLPTEILVIPPTISPVISTPYYTNINDQFKNGVSRASVGANGTVTFCFDIPENKRALIVQVVGVTLETNATLTWTFPDGRVFPTDPNQGLLLGPGNASVDLKLRSQHSFPSNIPDQYIPSGRHYLTIAGILSGYMSVEF